MGDGARASEQAGPVASSGVNRRSPGLVFAGLRTGLLVAVVPAPDAVVSAESDSFGSGKTTLPVALGAAGLAMGLSARQSRRREPE